MPRSIAVLGMDPSSRDLINNVPEETEVWGLNAGHLFMSRSADRWFQVHDRSEDGSFDMEGRTDALQHQNFLQNFEGPVYTVEVDPAIPTSVRYPIEEMTEEFGEYFTSTICYQLALAIHELEKGDHLALIGVHMGEGVEFVQQKAGVEYFLGVARGRGIHVALPTNTTLLKSPLYGRGQEWAAYERLNARYLGLKLKHESAHAEAVGLELRMEECEHSMFIATGMRPPAVNATSQIIFRNNNGPALIDPSRNGVEEVSAPEPIEGQEAR